MSPYLRNLAVTSIALFSTASARIITRSGFSPRVLASSNCSDVTQGVTPNCYADLGLADYITQWAASKQCYQGEGFANCFLRQNGLVTHDCQGITQELCPAVQSDTLIQDARAFSVAVNIASLNEYFTEVFVSLGQASQSAKAKLDALNGFLKPVNSGNAAAPDGDQYIKQVMAAQARINQTLVGIMSNATTFVTYTRSGKFNDPGIASGFGPLTQQVQQGVFADIAARSLNASGVCLTVAPNTSVAALTTNGTQLAYSISCQSSASSNGVCDAWWDGNSTKSAYGLVSTSEPQKNLGPLTTSLLKSVVSGPALFEASYACSATGYLALPDQINFDVTPDRLIDFNCAAAPLAVYTWDMICHSTDKVGQDPTPDSNCEFLERPRFLDFWRKKGDGRLVPAAYLGPALTQGKLKITRN